MGASERMPARQGATTGPGGQLPRGLVVEPMAAAPLRRLARFTHTLYRPRLGLGRDPAAMHPVLAGWRPEVLVVGNRTRVDATLLDVLAGLRVVGRLGSGLDNIDVEALGRRRVALVHAPDSGSVAVAELVFAYMLSVARPLAAADRHVRRGGWEREGYAGSELWRKRLGVVGLGAIGLRVALRARAFGMEVVASDPGRRPGDVAFAEWGVRRVSLDELLGTSRFVSVHVPLTVATRGLIGPQELARLLPTSHLIVTARGGIVDEPALAAALRAGRLAGALLDVRPVEPPPRPDPLADVPGLVLTPHIGGLTPEARLRTGHAVVDGIRDALARSPSFPTSGV